MARLQLSLNVSDLDAAVDFYRRLFGVEPAKLRPGYANFAVADPPLKLVLNAPGSGAAGTINHLGVEVDSTDEVAETAQRLEASGLLPTRDDGVCCYADQSKVWVDGPDGKPWEVYAVLADVDEPARTASCCGDAGC